MAAAIEASDYYKQRLSTYLKFEAGGIEWHPKLLEWEQVCNQDFEASTTSMEKLTEICNQLSIAKSVLRPGSWDLIEVLLMDCIRDIKRWVFPKGKSPSATILGDFAKLVDAATLVFTMCQELDAWKSDCAEIMRNKDAASKAAAVMTAVAEIKGTYDDAPTESALQAIHDWLPKHKADIDHAIPHADLITEGQSKEIQTTINNLQNHLAFGFSLGAEVESAKIESALEMLESLGKATKNWGQGSICSTFSLAMRMNDTYREGRYHELSVDDVMKEAQSFGIYKELLHQRQLLHDAMYKLDENAVIDTDLLVIKTLKEFSDMLGVTILSVSALIEKANKAELKHSLELLKGCARGLPREDTEGYDTWLDRFSGGSFKELREHADETLMKSDAPKLGGFIRACLEAESLSSPLRRCLSAQEVLHFLVFRGFVFFWAFPVGDVTAPASQCFCFVQCASDSRSSDGVFSFSRAPSFLAVPG